MIFLVHAFVDCFVTVATSVESFARGISFCCSSNVQIKTLLAFKETPIFITIHLVAFGAIVDIPTGMTHVVAFMCFSVVISGTTLRAIIVSR